MSMKKTPAKPGSQDAPIVGEDGQFHLTDQEVDLSKTTFEGWVSLGFFWLLGATVFHQFFTRYVLNDSAAWTEEIARYLLIATVFVGAAVGVTRNNHVQVDVLYRVLPAKAGRVLSTLVDVLRVLFFGACVVLTAMLMKTMGDYQMTIIDLPMNILYGICLFGFICMTGRAAWLSVQHWRQGFSGLEQPDILN
jgi:TRAP-type C4-dicarboxylate transport system permease small subunit